MPNIVLPPGNYVIEVDVDRVELAEGEPPYVRMACVPSGAELIRKPVSMEGGNEAMFNVPADCRAQALSLAAQPASGLGTVSGTVRAVRIARAR